MDPNLANAAIVISQCEVLHQQGVLKKDLKKAEEYLTKVQQASNSWSIFFDILNMDDLQVQVYAQVVIFLKQKFQFDFYQLPQAEYWNIVQLLMRYLMKFDHPTITKNLSMALVLLYMNAFETLGDLIDILESTLMADHKKEGLGLGIIKIMFEFSSLKTVVINQKQKDKYTSYLTSTQSSKVLAILEKHAKNETLSDRMKTLMLDAFQELVYFSRKNESLIENIHNHSCFSLALASLKNPFIAEEARLTLNTVLKNMKTETMQTHITELISQHLSEYMAQCKAVIKDDESHAVQLVICLRLFTVKSIKVMITKSDEQLLELFHFFVELIKDDDLTIDLLEEVMTFWGEIPKEFFELLKNSPFTSRVEEFNEIFKELIKNLCERIEKGEDQLRCSLDDYDENIPDDELDDGFNDPDKEDERLICKKLLPKIKDILGFPTIFGIICQNYDTLIAKIREESLEYENPVSKSASQLESLMYAVKACLASLDEKPDMTEFADLIACASKFNNPKINKTKTLLIQAITTEATVSENTKENIFNYLLERLPKTNIKVEGIIEEALMDFCEEWNSFVINNFETNLEMGEQFDQNKWFLASLGLAVIKNDQTDLQAAYLSQLFTPLAERVLKNVEIWENNQDEGAVKEIILNVNKLAFAIDTMFTDPKTYDNKAHPLEPFFQQLWPILKTLFEKFSDQDHGKVIGRVCHLMKKSLRTLGTKFEPFMIEYIEVICDKIPHNPHPSYLYALEVSVSIFGKIPHMQEPLTKAFETAAKAFLSEIHEAHNDADLVEDYFGMLFRYTKYLPKTVLYSKTLEKNLHLTQAGFDVDDPRIEKTILLFMEYLFKLCGNKTEEDIAKAMSEIMIGKYGAIFFRKLIAKFITYPEETIRQYILDAIFAAFIHLKTYVLQWLESAFEQVPEAILSQIEKQDIIESLNKIDVTRPKPEPKAEKKDGPQEVWEVSEDFAKVFDPFEFRCMLVFMREARFERSNIV